MKAREQLRCSRGWSLADRGMVLGRQRDDPGAPGGRVSELTEFTRRTPDGRSDEFVFHGPSPFGYGERD